MAECSGRRTQLENLHTSLIERKEHGVSSCLKMMSIHHVTIQMEIVTITKENYIKEVIDFKGTVLLDFWAPWCGPCKMLAPILKEIASDTEEDVKICKINVDEQKELAENFNVMNIPFIVIVKNGKIIKTTVGLKSKQVLINMLK